MTIVTNWHEAVHNPNDIKEGQLETDFLRGTRLVRDTGDKVNGCLEDVKHLVPQLA